MKRIDWIFVRKFMKYFIMAFVFISLVNIAFSLFVQRKSLDEIDYIAHLISVTIICTVISISNAKQ